MFICLAKCVFVTRCSLCLLVQMSASRNKANINVIQSSISLCFLYNSSWTNSITVKSTSWYKQPKQGFNVDIQRSDIMFLYMTLGEQKCISKQAAVLNQGKYIVRVAKLVFIQTGLSEDHEPWPNKHAQTVHSVIYKTPSHETMLDTLTKCNKNNNAIFNYS